MNSENNSLSVMSFNGPRTLFNSTNLSSIISTTSVGAQCAIASQYGNLFIAGKYFQIDKIDFLIRVIKPPELTRILLFFYFSPADFNFS
jgi:hypothetical protein